MTSKKIQNVLSILQKQYEYEDQHEKEIPHSERMLSIRKDTGLFYNILLKSMKAKHVLEIGMSVGYSTLWFADAVISNTNDQSKTGEIITIDSDFEKIKRATKNFEDADINQIIHIKKGLAKDILSQLQIEKKIFDFIFIDADKENYIEYFDLCLPMVRKGGIIAADNILIPEKFNKLMKNYVDHIKKIPNVESVTIPIDNGEEITIKI